MTSKCKRCGGPFEPKPTGLAITKMTTCCERCKFRNILDGLGLPTHPAMLDHYTKHPTLTIAEYEKELRKL